MSVQNGERLVTKQDLSDFYDGIRPYMGGMPEVLANKFSKGDMYSTDEKMIGQWIDGKPLYQKVIQEENVSFTTSFRQYGSVGVSNINVIRFDYLIHDGNDNVVYGQNVTEDATESYAYINESTGDFYLKLDKNWTSAVHKIVVIVQYTKTTDSPISIGNETDYSTEEKIIGTWIDGKPLYQKTYSTSVNVGSSTTFDIPIITDFEYIDFVRCEVIRSSDSARYTLPNSGCNVIIMPNKSLRLNTASGVSYIGTLIFTLQYTKTTD